VTLLSTNIKALRKKKKITQDQLANRCGVSSAAVSQWESQALSTSPDIHKLLKLSRLFNVTVEQMMCAENVLVCSARNAEVSDRVLEKVFAALSQNKTIEKIFYEGDEVRKSRYFKLFYTLLHDIEADEILDDDGLMALISLTDKQDDPDDPPKKK